MTDWKYGDKITWTEGSQMDRMTHKGIVIKVETRITVVDEDGQNHELKVDSYEAVLKRGWKKNVK